MGLKTTLFGKTETPSVIAMDKIEFDPLDVAKTASGALDAAAGQFDKGSDLATKTTEYLSKSKRDALETALPGFGKLQGKLVDLTSKMMDNPYGVPDDIYDEMKQQSAEFGIRSGAFGSEANKMSLVKNLGVESYKLGNQRMELANNLFGRLVSTAPSINPVSPLAFAATTGQTLQTEQWNKTTQVNVDTINAQAKQMAAQQAENQRAASASKSGLMGTIGTIAGAAVGGPWGAMIGGSIGGMMNQGPDAIMSQPGMGAMLGTGLSMMSGGPSSVVAGGSGWGDGAAGGGSSSWGGFFSPSKPSLPPVGADIGTYGGGSGNLMNS